MSGTQEKFDARIGLRSVMHENHPDTVRAIATQMRRDLGIEGDENTIAANKGVGIAEHLDKFISGDEQKFTRIFVISDPFHSEVYKAFWSEVNLKYTIKEVVDDRDDPRLKRIEFTDCGAGLIERSDFAPDGETVVSVNYEGYVTTNQPPEMLGRLATEVAAG